MTRRPGQQKAGGSVPSQPSTSMQMRSLRMENCREYQLQQEGFTGLAQMHRSC